MLTGEIRNQIDRIWDAFWSGGIANPVEVIEQITYLLFLKRLDEVQELEERKAARLGKPLERRIFPKGKDSKDLSYEEYRWKRFKNADPQQMYERISEHVFPFLRTLGDGSTYANYMRDARFTIPTPALLAKVVDLIDHVPMDNRDTKGDVYEYMLGKLSSSGQNGQFRTPRHIIRLMVELTAPTPKDVLCDPAAGTCGFLVGTGEYLRERHANLFADAKLRKHFHDGLFHGFETDAAMLRIGSMNMLLHGVENPDVQRRDSLAQDHSSEEEKYTLVLANPPFAGSLDYENVAKDLQRVVKTKKTELLFLALFVRLLRPGGRAAVIVPDGVLFGSSTAHKTLRKLLVDDQKLDGVISLPGGAFRPYAGVSTAILLFTKTNSGGTDHVWFYDVQADGWSLDDKRQPMLDADKLGPSPRQTLTKEEHAKNNFPDVLARWQKRDSSERKRPRTAQSFCVPKIEIVETGYDLSLNRYKQVVYEEVAHVPPKQILAELMTLEREIDPIFLSHFFQSDDYWKQITQSVRGVAQPGVNARTLGTLRIPLPPMEEQRRIAAILDQAEALRAKRREALAKLDTLTQSLFLEMFGDPALNPKKWPVVRIGQMLESANYGSSIKANAHGDYPMLRMNNITTDGRLDINALKYVDLPNGKEHRWLARDGDILFNRTNSTDLVGKTTVFRLSTPMAFAGYLIRLRVNSNAIPEYVSAFLNSQYGKMTLKAMCKSIIGMANINAKEVQTIKIPAPPTSLQRTFYQRIQALAPVRNRIIHDSEKFTSLSLSLQHRAFRGDL